MALEINKVEYYNFIIESNAGEAYKLLSEFAKAGIGLLAFRAVPAGDNRSIFSLFPNDSSKMKSAAEKAGINIDGPYPALIIKSNSDEPGECADIFNRLSRAGINDYDASGIADIKDSYGVVLCMKKEDCEKALKVLN
ncbi:MAG: hypothetical protein JXA06_13765 [Bacteroidetes bacterium]|nr:hypothetical protein [Bacteroidota bacterium]